MTRINHQNTGDNVPRVSSPSQSGADATLASAGKPTQQNDGIQLSKLSSVLNSLETGAAIGRRRIEHFATLVRSGTYLVDAFAVSRRLISEATAA